MWVLALGTTLLLQFGTLLRRFGCDSSYISVTVVAKLLNKVSAKFKHRCWQTGLLSLVQVVDDINFAFTSVINKNANS